MARPRKCRRVCRVPEKKIFGPLNDAFDKEQIILVTVEEYEVIRLLDLAGLTQEECAERMNIARTSVQRLYTCARKKMAESFINGKFLTIEGGDYQECDGQNIHCCDNKCYRRCDN